MDLCERSWLDSLRLELRCNCNICSELKTRHLKKNLINQIDQISLRLVRGSPCISNSPDLVTTILSLALDINRSTSFKLVQPISFRHHRLQNCKPIRCAFMIQSYFKDL